MYFKNTYRTEPKVPFNQDKCDCLLKQVIDHAMEIVKFLWDPDRDGYSSYTYDTPQFFCSAAIYAIYME